MKADDWDDAVLAEHRAHLLVPDAQAAFDELAVSAAALPAHDCSPGWHGAIRDFRYVDRASGERPFAFIVNRSDLLFYVRKPGLGRVPGGFASLKQRFRAVSENPSGEWTVHIQRAQEARELVRFLFGGDSHELATASGGRLRGVRFKAKLRSASRRSASALPGRPRAKPASQGHASRSQSSAPPTRGYRIATTRDECAPERRDVSDLEPRLSCIRAPTSGQFRCPGLVGCFRRWLRCRPFTREFQTRQSRDALVHGRRPGRIDPMGPREVHEVCEQQREKNVAHGRILDQRWRRGCGA